MQNRITRCFAALLLALGVSTFTSLKAAEKQAAPQMVTLADVPAAVRATIEKEIPGAKIKSIEKEDEDGKVVYDVEAKFEGKHVEMDIASDGSILSRENEVPYASLPAAVKSAAEKYFGSAADLEASKEVAGGKTSYEVEGKQAGQKVTLKLDDTGKLLEEEKRQNDGEHDEKD